ncbi:A/G-specific adenine glycosylase [Terribacillus sp. 7520-G]|uniref:A/G-specific adenine glycosylase n=1 Tax=Terribacillus halophilus TaxID=361279 RepID=UPI000BA7BD4A|nr:A/G-specific adenine glycosylase [Terribacillus sp. 7520-G]
MILHLDDLHVKFQHFSIDLFQDDLINWFQQEKRSLPWRETRDPYRIWVSEIMLQQTKVDTVIPYFNRFMERFPTIQALAEADEQDVLKAWEGLGYYSRARNLQTAVREVARTYGGKVPDDVDELGKLKGVGPYTKGAILSIAYGIPQPAVDGNVMRVLSRILLITEDIAKPKARKIFEAAVEEMISKEDPSSYNQGLMELGALICTPKKPACMLCPVQEHCAAFRQGLQEELPIKSKGKKQKTMPYLSVVVENPQGEVLIEKRPQEGLLANLWQFPMADAAEVSVEQLAYWFKLEYGIEIELVETLQPVRHVFSHIIWEIIVLRAKTTDAIPEQGKFVALSDIDEYPFPVPHQKILHQFHIPE